MIRDSWYWKRELIDQLGLLETWAARHHEDLYDWEGELDFRLERSIFYIALAIRRLLESQKVSDTLERSSFELTVFKSRNDGPISIIQHMGSNDLAAEYDFDSPSLEMFNPHRLASEIIHSFTLEFYSNESEYKIDGFYIASQKNNFNRLIEIPLIWLHSFVNRFIEDDVCQKTIFWDQENKKIIVKKNRLNDG